MNKQITKKTAQYALKAEYGFAPSMSEIQVLEASGDRTYILFRVGQWEYEFKSYIFSGKSVWAGPGHIRKTARFVWTDDHYERESL